MTAPALAYALAAGLLALGWLAQRRFLSDGDPAQRFLAHAVGLMGVFVLTGPLGRAAPGSLSLINSMATVVFAASGFSLLRVRDELAPLPRQVLALAGGGIGVVTMGVLIAGVPSGPGERASGVEAALLLLLLAVWSGCVAEPWFRCRRLAAGRPMVQAARLRLISAGFGGLLLVVVTSVAIYPTGNGRLVSLAGEAAALGPVALLFAGLAPPRWLYSLWRAREEQRLLQVRSLFASADAAELATRGLEWTTGLVGADAGLVAGPAGGVLAAFGLAEDEAERLAEELRPIGEGGLVREEVDRFRAAIALPINTDIGSGTLLVLAGPHTPRLGAEEVRLARHYASALAIAFDHLRLSEMKDMFLTAVSHDVRTPLTSVLGGVKLLREKYGQLPEAAVHDQLTRLDTNARRLDTMLADLLDFDRLSRGVLEARRQLTDVDGLVADVTGRWDGRGRTIELDLRSAVVNVDRAQVERIMENLLSNAAKHTPAETTVWVRTRSEVDGVLLVVEDNGPGVGAEMRDTAFEPFRRGRDAPEHAPGTGLGLALVARFAELHAGRTWVQDRPGGGASFRVWLPGAQSERGDRLGPSLRQSLTSRRERS